MAKTMILRGRGNISDLTVSIEKDDATGTLTGRILQFPGVRASGPNMKKLKANLIGELALYAERQGWL